MINNFGIDLSQMMSNAYSTDSPIFIDPSFQTSNPSTGVIRILAGQMGGDQKGAANNGGGSAGPCGMITNMRADAQAAAELAAGAAFFAGPETPVGAAALGFAIIAGLADAVLYGVQKKDVDADGVRPSIGKEILYGVQKYEQCRPERQEMGALCIFGFGCCRRLGHAPGAYNHRWYYCYRHGFARSLRFVSGIQVFSQQKAVIFLP